MDAASFSTQDAEAIFSLAERLTGNSVRGNLILSNVGRRMEATGARSLFEYLRLAETDPLELPHLISALVVHTTSWFREEPHFPKFKEYLDANLSRFRMRPLRVLSAACSTGEEVFSFGLVLEAYRRANPGFEYVIEGRDIDVLCTNKGTRAVYPKQEMERIPPEYSPLLMEGTGKTSEFFTVVESLRSRVRFSNWNLVRLPAVPEQSQRFDYILCRNVLIYFSATLVEKVVNGLLGLMADGGALCLGHSESVDFRKFELESLGNSIYVRAVSAPASASSLPSKKIVLVIDDSASVRKVIVRLMEGTDFIPVTVGSAEEATEYLRTSRVDIITLDLNMPGQDGVSWLAARRQAGMRVPVVIVSDDYPTEATANFGALENGAQDYFHKGQIITGKDELLGRFADLIESARQKAIDRPDDDLPAVSNRQRLRRPDLILVGASIGGPEALARLVAQMPEDLPPLVIVQHISIGFAKAFAEHLSEVSGLRLVEAIHGIGLERSCLYMAQGDYHVGVRRSGTGYVLQVSPTQPVKRHRPSIDFMFSSLGDRPGAEKPELANDRVFGAILTGMGSDGAEGLLKLRKTGAMTFAQERKSCVVFGMAKEAVRLGAVGYIGTIMDIRRQLELALQMSEQQIKESAEA